MASIHVIQGPDKGRTFELHPEENVLGRQSETIDLTDGTISRRHSRLIPQDGSWMIEDMGSANGTWVNGVKLRRPQKLQQGDQIRLGGTLLVFGGLAPQPVTSAVDMDKDNKMMDSAIMASVPSNEDSIILPTPEAGVEAIGNLRILYNLITTISTIFDVDLLLNRVLDQVFEVMHADRGFVLMIDETNAMMPKAVRYREGKDEQQLPISSTIVNHVVSNQVGVLCSNAMSDKRFAKGHSVHAFGIRSALCVPIKGRDRILGVLHVDSSVSNYTYSTEQLRLLTAIGYQTGLAVENVRLYEAAVKSERLAAIGETVASLSHHIKNILQALRSGTDVVEMALKAKQLEKATQAWPIVTRNLDRINTVILNMLAFSKRRRPLLTPYNINQVINDCLELVTPHADEKNVAILADLGEMPAIPADPDGLHQAVLNLLTNAVDAVDEGTGAITVSSAFDSMNRLVRITITDNGPGVDAATQKRLFEPFFSTKGQRGTGLGLAVARKIVREHGGDIVLKSKPGQGATFVITLSTASDSEIPADQTHGPNM